MSDIAIKRLSKSDIYLIETALAGDAVKEFTSGIEKIRSMK